MQEEASRHDGARGTEDNEEDGCLRRTKTLAAGERLRGWGWRDLPASSQDATREESQVVLPYSESEVSRADRESVISKVFVPHLDLGGYGSFQAQGRTGTNPSAVETTYWPSSSWPQNLPDTSSRVEQFDLKMIGFRNPDRVDRAMGGFPCCLRIGSGQRDPALDGLDASKKPSVDLEFRRGRPSTKTAVSHNGKPPFTWRTEPTGTAGHLFVGSRT